MCSMIAVKLIAMVIIQIPKTGMCLNMELLLLCLSEIHI